jgi:hypothetical protein
MRIRHPNSPEDRDQVLTLAAAFATEGLAQDYHGERNLHHAIAR